MGGDREASGFSEILRGVPDSIREVALALRRQVLLTLPDASEAIGGGDRIRMALYSIGGPNNVVCGIQPTASACKLFLHGWQVLVQSGFRLEGSGKHARHIKLRDVSELERLEVARMISIARRAVGI